jgi:hypothetical protein
MDSIRTALPFRRPLSSQISGHSGLFFNEDSGLYLANFRAYDRESLGPPFTHHRRQSVATNRGDIVIDPFLGSARPLSPPKTERACRGVELDPLYIDVTIRRYEAATGDAAALVETGESFEPLALRRAN